MILQQAGGRRRIPIIIGFPEAQAIQCKLQEVSTPRPLTHDTMVSSLAAFGISLIEVVIRRLSNGVFAADLVFTDGNSRKVIDARSSDAVALAIRAGAPIYTSEEVLRETGFDPDTKDEDSGESNPEDAARSTSAEREADLTTMTLTQLSEAMMRAAEDEDYEEAAKIKNEIDRRNSKPDNQ